jgi:hypothetical protein
LEETKKKKEKACDPNCDPKGMPIRASCKGGRKKKKKKKKKEKAPNCRQGAIAWNGTKSFFKGKGKGREAKGKGKGKEKVKVL